MRVFIALISLSCCSGPEEGIPVSEEADSSDTGPLNSLDVADVEDDADLKNDANEASADTGQTRDALPTQTEVDGRTTVYEVTSVEPVSLTLPESSERTCPSWELVGPVVTRFARVVWAAADDDVWGLNGPSLWHWDGNEITMTPTVCGLQEPAGLWGSHGELWAATRSGSVWHRDIAGAWLEQPLTHDVQLNAIAGIATDDIWVAGMRGFLAHWDGRSWSAMRLSASNGANPDMMGLWAGDGEVWATGTVNIDSQISEGPGVAFRLRDQWERVLERRGTVEGVWGWNRNDVIVGGGAPQVEGWAPRLQRFDGATWTDVSAPWVGRISRIAGPSPDDLYVFGWGSTTWHNDHGVWTELGTGPGDSRGYRTDDMAMTATSMWSLFSELGRFHGATFEPLWRACCVVHDIAGRGPNDVWLIGERGLVMHWNGVHYIRENGIENAWTEADLNSRHDLRSAWVAPDSTVWAVGDRGMVWRRGGDGRWRRLDTPSSLPLLTGVWGAGEDVWITGLIGSEDFEAARGILWRWRGTGFEVVFGASDQAQVGGLRAIDGSAPDDIWVAGRGPGLWHFDGLGWSPMVASTFEGEPLDVNLSTVVSVGPGEAFAGGAPDQYPGVAPYNGLLVHADTIGVRVFQADRDQQIQKLWVSDGRGVAFDTRPRAWLLEADGGWTAADIEYAQMQGPTIGSLWSDGTRLWLAGFEGKVWRSPTLPQVYQSLRDRFAFTSK